MCGICGIYAYRAGACPVDGQALVTVRDAMRRRGPDGEGLWLSSDRRVGLGHRRLSIIELSSAGSQPMHDIDDRLSIVFNGEIYNYQELRDELVGAGRRFNSHSDTEVILELYKRHGTAAFERLRGMFALAIWDAQERCLVLARDPFGIKPLYVADDGQSLRFASQVKALLAGGGIDERPEPAGHAGFFLWGHVPEPFTLYRGITSFPAGHYQIIRDGRVEAPIGFADMRQVLSEAEQAAAPAASADYLHDLLLESVAHHHVADVPVGVFLSAGRDSTTIAALSRELGSGSLRTFTLGFENYRGTARDEVPLAELVAAQLETRQTTEWVAEEEFAQCADDLFSAMDQPSIDGVNTYFVSRLMAKAGIKVALSGLGGDELFGGYPSFAEVPKAASTIGRIPLGRRVGGIARQLSSGWIGRLTSPKYAGLLEYGGSIPGAFLLRRALHMPWELAGILGRDMAEEGLSRLQPLASMGKTIEGIRDPYLAVMLLELNCYMCSRLLRDSDWASMAHSLELRVPLVDWHFFKKLAPHLAHGHRPRKSDLVNAPRTALPKAVVDRAKTGFDVPVRDWLMMKSPRGIHTQMRGRRSWARIVHGAFA